MITHCGVAHIGTGEGGSIKILAACECSFVRDAEEVERVTGTVSGSGSNDAGGGC